MLDEITLGQFQGGGAFESIPISLRQAEHGKRGKTESFDNRQQPSRFIRLSDWHREDE